MTMTTTTYGAEFGYEEQINGIIAWINGADDLAADEKDKLADELFDELRREVNRRLPEDVSWWPHTSEFVKPAYVDLPAPEEMAELFREAWNAVAGRLAEIERRLFGALPATIEDLERALLDIADPLRRARVAGLLTDPGTRAIAARIRAAAVYEATRERSADDVAVLLGTGVAAIRKLIREHNRAEHAIP